MSASISVVDQSKVSEDINKTENFNSNNTANSTKPPHGINLKVIFHPGLHVDHSGKYGNRKVYRLNGQVGPHESPIILTDPRLTTTQRKPRLRQESKQELELTEFLYDKNSRGPPPPTSILLSNLPVMKESTIKAMLGEDYIRENPRTAARRAVEKGNGRRIGSNNVVVEFDPDEITSSSHNNNDDMEIGDAPIPPSIPQLSPPSYPYIKPSSAVLPIQRMNGPPPSLYPNTRPVVNDFKAPYSYPDDEKEDGEIDPYYDDDGRHDRYHEKMICIYPMNDDWSRDSNYKHPPPLPPPANRSRNPSEPSFSRNGSRSSSRTRGSFNKRAKEKGIKHYNSFDTSNKPSWLVTISHSSLPYYKAKIVDLKRHFRSYSFERITQDDKEWCVYFTSESQARRFFKENNKKRLFDCEIHLNLYHQNKKLDDSSSSSHHSREKQSKSSISVSLLSSHNNDDNIQKREEQSFNNAPIPPPHQLTDMSQILQQSTKILVGELSKVFQKDIKNKVVGKFIFDFLTPKIQERKQQRLAKLKSKNEEKKQQPEIGARELSELGPFKSKYTMLHSAKLPSKSNGNGLRDYNLKFRKSDSDFRDRRSSYNKDQKQSSSKPTISSINSNKRQHPSSKYDNSRSNKKIKGRKSPLPTFEFTDSESEDKQGEKSEDLATCSNKQEVSSSSEEGEIHTDDELFPENQKSPPPKQELLEKPKHAPLKVEKPHHQQQRLRDYLSEDDDSDPNDFLEEFNKHESQREQENHSPANEDLMDVDKSEFLTDDIINKVDRLPKRKKRRLSNQSSKTIKRLTKSIDFTSSESEEEPELKHKNDTAVKSTKKIIIPMVKVNKDNINNIKKEQPQKQVSETKPKTLVITYTGSGNNSRRKSLIHLDNISIIPPIKSEENNEPTLVLTDITDESEKNSSESDLEDREEINSERQDDDKANSASSDNEDDDTVAIGYASDNEADIEFTDTLEAAVPMSIDPYESVEESDFDEEEAEEPSSPGEVFDEEDFTFLEIVVKEFEQDPAIYTNDSMGEINYDAIDRYYKKRKQEIAASKLPGQNPTGCARTEGYKRISEDQKLRNMINNTKKPMVTNSSSSSPSLPLISPPTVTSRENRMKNRGILANMQQYNRETAKGDVDDVMRFNQMKGRTKQLKFAKSSIHSMGLFTKERIDANDMVIEYIGEVIRQSVADHRERR
ncbi:1492_t:CDS:10 [Ambispora leptoticha]|uniref:1492_t:CDS:1 n=1 Tax=Ambispora leptoticha TaxID=144679 RepID=A0A9N9B279_9GLOM|nr:1492_t:CDS:10 [Ambispora leptoticha]